jgi:flagellar biosynthesis/type III secretory pathway M-ring protein FliF/YscJ
MSLIAVAPALPLHTAGKYVAGAYIVFLAIVLIYVAIMATRLARTERELSELAEEVQRRREAQSGDPDRGGHQPDRDREPVA